MAAMSKSKATTATKKPKKATAKTTAPTDHESSSVQVAIRIRPMLASEAGNTQCVEVLSTSSDGPPNVVRIGGDKGPRFTFDHAFDGHTPQEDVFSVRVMPLIDSCLQGYNATTLAYGQTGSGKTYSMMGPSMSTSNGSHAGIIPRAIQSLFDALTQFQQDKQSSTSKYHSEVRIQFLELYGEEIRDLLTTSNSKEKLVIRDYGSEPEVAGATQPLVTSPEEALLCLSRGMLRRVTATTAMNATSSRSHAIISILVEQTTTSNAGEDAVTGVLRSKFNFVDLAGSERVKRTQAEGKRLKEGIDINKGLLVLGNVISALGDPAKAGGKHAFVPYRDSKLTRLLKGSLGGNHKTLMIACVSPSSSNLDESLNCLRYANRAKNIQNNAIVNVDAGTRIVIALKQQVSALATELLKTKTSTGADEKEEASAFTVEVLQELIGGGNGSSGKSSGGESTKATIMPVTPGAISYGGGGSTPASALGREDERVEIAESQLDQTRSALQKATDDLKSMTEDLFTVRAERELYRLRLETGGSSEATGGLDTAFLEKAAAYEREIATLKEAVQAKPTTMMSTSPPEDEFLTRTSQALEKQKAQLQQLQSELQIMSPNTSTDVHVEAANDEDDAEMEQLRSQVMQSMSSTKELEAEEDAANRALSALTKKFLPDDEDNEQAPDLVHDSPEKALAQQQKLQEQKKLEVELVDLSNSINDKEVLIDQLQLSQQKYANMRAFYEEKLQQMEQQVKEREAERLALIAELHKAETSGPRSNDLEKALRDKERHITGLKKRQTELMNLTKVSSTNEGDIGRLRSEITGMKQKKVELQKMINCERKNHLGELNRLKKEVTQRDREANKWKRISDKKTIEAEKSQQVAKSRLEQIGALKAKYSEAEKKLRVKTVKRGVMEKAGLDSVIVGRRTVNKVSSKRNTPKPQVDVDSVRDFLDKKVADVGRKEATADKLAHEWEDHLDLLSKKQALQEARASKEAIQKVDEQLTYKEERIRKLAERIGKQPSNTPGNDDEKQELFFESDEFKKLLPEAFTVNGAKLTSRILFGMVVRERRRVASLARTASTLNEKLIDAENTTSEKEAAFRSYQDEERADRAALAISQQEHILSLMAMVQEDDSSVTTAERVPGSPVGLSASMPNIYTSVGLNGQNSRMAVLANEKVEALERQLSQLQGERESMEMYRAMEAETKAELTLKSQECEELRKGADHLRETLRSIREAFSGRGGDSMAPSSENEEDLEEDIVALVTSALRSSKQNAESTIKRFGPSHNLVIAPVESEDEDEEIPEWAGDIMADLAVIAGGNIPEALMRSPEFGGHDAAPSAHDAVPSTKEKEKGSVFDRLTNPSNFTGVQKRRNEQNARRGGHHAREKKYIKPINLEKGQEDRKAMSQKVSEQLEDFFQAPHVEPVRSASASKSQKSRELKDGPDESVVSSAMKPKRAKDIELPERRSVFERLLSPSMYTGTQKEKIKEEQAKKSLEADELLGGLLASTLAPQSPTQEEFEAVIEPKQPGIDIATQVANRLSEYAQEDVFERLQKTTTQSYAVKQHHPPLSHVVRSLSSPARATSPDDEVTEKHEPVQITHHDLEHPSPLRDRSAYTQQNVFKRLQETSTHAFAKKKNPGNEINSATRLDPPISIDDQNGVFERLQTTTTHSFAGKQHREGDEGNH